MKRTALILLALCATILLPLPAFAIAQVPDNVITKEYDFIAFDTDFEYDAPSQITENGIVYYRKGIRYETTEEKELFATEGKLFTREKSIPGLPDKNDSKFPKEMEIDEDGFKGAIPRQAIAYEEQKQIGDTSIYNEEIDLGEQVESPAPASEREILYTDKVSKKNAVGNFPLKEVKRTTEFRWQSGHVATLHVMGGIMDVTASSPQYYGSESALFAAMRLDSSKYRITGARWLGGESGENRMIEFTMDRFTARFVGVYELSVITPDAITYDGIASYEGELTKEVPSGKEYHVKAIVTYEAPVTATPSPEPSPTPSPTPEPSPEPEPPDNGFPVAAAVAIPLVVCAAEFVFFWRKKKKNHGEDQ